MQHDTQIAMLKKMELVTSGNVLHAKCGRHHADDEEEVLKYWMKVNARVKKQIEKEMQKLANQSNSK